MRSEIRLVKRLAIMLGLIVAWAGVSGGQALAHANGPSVIAPAPLSIVAQPITPTITIAEPVGPVVTSTAASAITATVATTATATIAATATPSGPPPPTVSVPVVEGETPLQVNPFDAGFLFSTPRPPMGPFAWASFALMISLLGLSGYFYAVKRPQWKRNNTVLYRAANRWSQPGLWLAVVGLLFVLFRIVGLDFFDKRFWLYLWLLTLIGMAAWFFYWYRTSYPKELEKFRRTQRAKQYMPGASAKTLARQPERTPKTAQQARTTQKATGSKPPAKAPGPKKSDKSK